MQIKNILLAISLLSSIQACTNAETPSGNTNSRLNLVPEPDRELRLEYERNQAFLGMRTDSLWKYLVFQKGGCLTGGQYVREGQRDDANCVMTAAPEWGGFFHREPRELTDLLRSKLADTATTRIHTCPYFMAKEGEVAVYALQQLYEMNSFDFEPFQHYRDSASSSAMDNPQGWLQAILQDDDQRALLRSYWQEQTEK